MTFPYVIRVYVLSCYSRRVDKCILGRRHNMAARGAGRPLVIVGLGRRYLWENHRHAVTASPRETARCTRTAACSGQASLAWPQYLRLAPAAPLPVRMTDGKAAAAGDVPAHEVVGQWKDLSPETGSYPQRMASCPQLCRRIELPEKMPRRMQALRRGRAKEGKETSGRDRDVREWPRYPGATSRGGRFHRLSCCCRA